MQEVEVLPEGALLENPLHFKTTSMGITAGENVMDYPYVPADWYRKTTEQSHVAESVWKCVEV